MDFLDHVGAVCALRFFEVANKRVEVIRAEPNPVPPRTPGGEWAVAWNLMYVEAGAGGGERSVPLAGFLERKPRPSRPGDFETYLAQHNVLLMLRDLPPVLADFSDPEGADAVREDFFDANVPVDEACKATETQVFNAPEEWDALTGIRHTTKSELFASEVKQLRLPAALSTVVSMFDPGKAAAPLPVQSSATTRSRH